MHGNEPAGLHGLTRVFNFLKENPDLNLGVSLVGLKGNMSALAKGVRQVNEDLNRMLKADIVEAAFAQAASSRELDAADVRPTIENTEYKEIRELIRAMEQVISDTRPGNVIVLDLHTTTTSGGSFAVTSPDPKSEQIASRLGSPVVRGIVKDVAGMTLSYFSEETLGLPTTSIIFESGQHESPDSVDMAVAAILGCVECGGGVRRNDLIDGFGLSPIVSAKIKQDSQMVVEVVHTHAIQEGDGFEMKPGFGNFVPVKQGQLLATDSRGDIRAPFDCMTLMPNYTNAGTTASEAEGIEGFFLIKELKCQ